MENVTDALYMAFAVLAFVVALSVSIIAFGQVRVASQEIIDAKDKTLTYISVEPTRDSVGNIVNTRTVKREDIIPSLYRAYKENYLVRFEGLENIGGRENIYEIKDLALIETNPSHPYRETNIIDLEGQSIGNQADANTFITTLLQANGTDALTNLDQTRFSYFGNYLQNRPFYDILGSSTFKEELGVFYQEDKITEDTGAGSVDSEDFSNDDVNKTEKRIITYTVL